jgi:hypothetical protein
MFGWGHGWGFFEAWGALASWIAGFFLFLVWLAIVVLFVRFLLIATRAAKVYLRNNGHNDGLLPQRAPSAPATSAPATSAPAATAPAATTKPAPRPRPKA